MVRALSLEFMGRSCFHSNIQVFGAVQNLPDLSPGAMRSIRGVKQRACPRCLFVVCLFATTTTLIQLNSTRDHVSRCTKATPSINYQHPATPWRSRSWAKAFLMT